MPDASGAKCMPAEVHRLHCEMGLAAVVATPCVAEGSTAPIDNARRRSPGPPAVAAGRPRSQNLTVDRAASACARGGLVLPGGAPWDGVGLDRCRARSVDDVQLDHGQAAEAQCLSPGGSQVDDPASDKWTAIRDLDDDRLAIPLVGHAHAGVKSKSSICRGQVIVVQSNAARSGGAISGRIDGRDTVLGLDLGAGRWREQHKRTGRRRNDQRRCK